MTFEEKLNKALYFLANNNSKGESYNRYSDIQNYFKTIPEIQLNEYPMIVLHLIEDGYVKMYEKYNDILIGDEQIKIKYKGYIFIKSGGYNSQMTKNEIKILGHLNRIRGNNNVYQVIADSTQITEHDVKETIDRLLEKDYVYEESDVNQKNLGLRAWKISLNGELKAKQLNENNAENSIGVKIKNWTLKYWIPVGIASWIFVYVAGIFTPLLSEMVKLKFLPKKQEQLKDSVPIKTMITIHDTIYLDKSNIEKVKTD